MLGASGEFVCSVRAAPRPAQGAHTQRRHHVSALLHRVMRVTDEPEAELPVSALGFDPLTEFPPFDEFKQRLSRRRGPVRPILVSS